MIPLNDLLGKLLLAELTFTDEQVLYPDLDVSLLRGAFEASLQLVELGLSQLARPLIDSGLELVLVCGASMPLLR